MALFYGLASGFVVIGVIWLIRKMLQQSYIDSMKDMLALVGMVSGLAWVMVQALDAPEGSAGPATGVSEFLCKRFGLQLTEMRSPN